jgi:hypothetical protein
MWQIIGKNTNNKKKYNKENNTQLENNTVREPCWR